MTEMDTGVRELNRGIFQIRGLNGSSHSYVIKGRYMNVMIDSGSDQNFPVLERGLFQIGLKVRDINLVINSHEHCDHIGANRYFQESAIIAAYRLAASKMVSGDYYVTMYKSNDLNEIPLRVHLWLENMTRIDLGNYSLRIFIPPAIPRDVFQSSKQPRVCSSRPIAFLPAALCLISPNQAVSVITSIR
jgi:hydroxyacylglutathione hydrolase